MSTPTTHRAAIYVRVSSEEQIDNTSLTEQRRICTNEIERHEGWALDPSRVYADEGKSGTDANRPDFRRLIADAHAGKVDALVVAQLDRFSRKTSVGIAEMDALDALGVVVVVVKERMDLSTIEGRLTRNILLSVAESERDRIVARTSAGQRAAAKMGRWPGGQPGFGWRLEGLKKDARPVPDEREREIVHTVYDLAVKRRKSAGAVAAFLNDTGRHPRGGASRLGSGMRWEHATIRQVFGNPALWSGEYNWGKPDGRKKSARSHHTKINPRTGQPAYGDTATVLMPEPPLTKGQFDALQRALHRRSMPADMRAPETQLLANRLVGRCGKQYNGIARTGTGSTIYKCSGRRYKSMGDTTRCTCSQFDVRWVDPIVWGEIVGLLSSPERLQAAAREWHDLDRDESQNFEAAHARGLDEQITRLERAVARLTEDVLFADDPEAQRERLTGLKSDLATLREQRATADAFRSDRQATARALMSLAEIAEKMRGELLTMSLANKRRIVEILDLHVVVTDWEPAAHGNGEHPVSVTITGRLDPRLFAGGEGMQREATHPAPNLGTPGGQPSPEAVSHTSDGEGSSSAAGIATLHAPHTSAGDRSCRWCS